MLISDYLFFDTSTELPLTFLFDPFQRLEQKSFKKFGFFWEM